MTKTTPIDRRALLRRLPLLGGLAAGATLLGRTPAAQAAAGTIILKDEGVQVGTVGTVNCVGAGITATAVGSTGTLTVPGGSAPWLATDTRYVSASGLDTNDGKSWPTAKRTLQAAYNDLPATGGIIYPASGRYDVGSGLALDRTKRCAIVGPVRPNRYESGGFNNTWPSAGVVLFSSTGAAALINLNTGTGNATGFQFHNLIFEFTIATQLYGLRAACINHVVMEDCMFFCRSDVANLFPVGIYAYVDPLIGDDCSWWRVNNCMTSAMALVRATGLNTPGSDANQHNRWKLSGNVGFGNGGRTQVNNQPFIKLMGHDGTTLIGNHPEALPIGVWLQDCTSMWEGGTEGENMDAVLDLHRVRASFFAPGGGNTANIGKFIQGDASTSRNLIFLPGSFADDAWSALVSLQAENTVISSNHGFHPGDYAAASTPGTVVGKYQVCDRNGAVVGYVPVYSSIT
jgi:hypothetical protein